MNAFIIRMTVPPLPFVAQGHECILYSGPLDFVGTPTHIWSIGGATFCMGGFFGHFDKLSFTKVVWFWISPLQIG